MDLYSFPPIAAVLDAAYSLLASLVLFIEPLAGASSATVAIVLVTLAVRTALIPVGVSQAKAEASRRRLAPMLAELKRQWSSRPDILRRKTIELYAAQKVSPFAGCLPLLAQGPVLSIVYGLFAFAQVNGHPNLLLASTLAGEPLGWSLLLAVQAGFSWSLAAHVGVIAVVAFAAWLSRRFALAAAAEPVAGRVGAVLGWLPLTTVVFASIAPLAAATYLAVSGSWTAVERRILRRRIIDLN